VVSRPSDSRLKQVDAELVDEHARPQPTGGNPEVQPAPWPRTRIDNRSATIQQQIVVQGNATFELVTARTSAFDELGPSSEAGVAPAPDPTTARLEDAYSRRDELTAIGEDTSDVDTEILSLRREQRQGPALHAGEFLGDGRFRLVKVIGHGGFATVWKAHDRSTNRPVAIKILHGEFAHVVSRRERLFRGAKRMAQLDHPNVVRVLVPEGEELGFHYCVLEYVAGGDLHQAVLHRRIGYAQALEVVESIAGALEAAHAQQLVHRDVKPQNILLHEDGTAALTDFDLVQAKDTTGGTRTGAMGTVLYAAPEQNEDARTVDHRADVYSLGMTAVFCIYGDKLPQAAMFKREEFLEELDCSKSVRDVLRRAVALAPEDRFQSMASLRAALNDARHLVKSEAQVGGAHVSRRSILIGVAAVVTVGLGYGTMTTVLREPEIEDIPKRSAKPTKSTGTSEPTDSTGTSKSGLNTTNGSPGTVNEVASPRLGSGAVASGADTDEKEEPAKPAPDAAALLKEARVTQFADPAAAYGLAKQSYDAKPSNDALWVMGASACRLEDEKKAQWVLERLEGADKTKLRDLCAQKGFVF
jgi:serine/threonine protein kinase